MSALTLYPRDRLAPVVYRDDASSWSAEATEHAVYVSVRGSVGDRDGIVGLFVLGENEARHLAGLLTRALADLDEQKAADR